MRTPRSSLPRSGDPTLQAGTVRQHHPSAPQPHLAHGEGTGGRRAGGTDRSQQSLFDASHVEEHEPGPRTGARGVIYQSFQTLLDPEHSQLDPRPAAADVIEGVVSQEDSRKATEDDVEGLTRVLEKPTAEIFRWTHRWMDPNAGKKGRKEKSVAAHDSREAREGLQADLESTRELIGDLDLRETVSSMGLELAPAQVELLRKPWQGFVDGIGVMLSQLKVAADVRQPLDLRELRISRDWDNGQFRNLVGRELGRAS